MRRTMLLAAAVVIAGLSLMSGRGVNTHSADDKNVADTLTLSGGKYLSRDMKVTVAVPESYRDETDTTHYPVLYLLNGHGGLYRTWPKIVNVDSLATAYNMIIVCPSGMNSWYWDSPVNPGMQMESFFINALIPAVDSIYRTIPVASKRSITGLSMGGHGALWLAMRHPDIFANAGSTSGGVNIIPFPNNWNMPDFLGEYAANPKRWEAHTVINLVDSLKPGQLNIIFDCGTEDFFYKVNCDLDKALNDRKIHHTFITGPGAHTTAYWSKSILPQIEYFHKVMNR